MYNRLYDYVTINNILLNKQFGFGAGLSPEHALTNWPDRWFF